MSAVSLSDNAVRALRVLTEQASDGYTLMSRTGLTADQLVTALTELRSHELVVVKGDLMPHAVGDVYAAVMPDAQGRAAFFVT